MDYALLMSTFQPPPGQRAWPRQRQLHECLRAAIRDGRLAAGTRLVATRALAAELGMARNTVLYAYEQLASEGYVSTDRRGTVVAALPAPAAPGAAVAPPHAGLSRRARALRGVMPQEILAGAFMPGVPALEAFPLTLWRRMLERAWRALPVQRLHYGDTAGEAPLRAAIADHLRAARGVVCEAGQVFITDGTQSSLDLCARSFADAGDTVWLENPGYGGALAACRAAALRVVGIAVDADGIAPAPADWRRRRPRLIYATPSHQYPTGSVLSLPRRLALIDGARAAGALIIEDDYDSEFRHDGPPLPAMQGLVADAPVLYLGTFSKTMFPALRIGFIVVPRALAPAFAALLAQTASRGRVAEQLALAEFLRSGQFALHLRRMRRLYRQRRDALVAALRRHFDGLATVHGGSAGMHLALRFDSAALDDAALSAQAARLGIVAPALSAQASAPGHGWRGFMLGYAQLPAERMAAPVAALAALVRAALTAGPASSSSSR
ncbi:PLP-dependent aminotransferase family protein [Janthinobacterium fluminis]|uniref:PLP-dependent aminotransferase family protein n=1 Tax=Janthinobacterium fluminis TaxID=2987524 RepID=A0ABT5K844_9BURK|nr:PLP-dependent aminotransferase family protein [Janthinobacterium fluminis]MDC8760815.1 PLP-dependent aminotransferase family protein [Janthinobacterium fluminis]